MLTVTERKEDAADIAARLHAALAYRRVKEGGYAAWATLGGARAWVLTTDRKVVFAQRFAGTGYEVSEFVLADGRTALEPKRWVCISENFYTRAEAAAAINHFADVANGIQELENV